jgi:hypothetical protein
MAYYVRMSPSERKDRNFFLESGQRVSLQEMAARLGISVANKPPQV